MTTTTKRPAKKRPAKKRTQQTPTNGRAHTNGQAGTNGKATAAKGAVGEPPAHVSMPDCRVDQIEPHPKNPRLAFDKDAMAELKESLNRHGLLEPVLVREIGAFSGGRSRDGQETDGDGTGSRKRATKKYQLLGGERRWRAAKELKWKTIPARLIDVDDVAALEILGAENLDRSNLTDIEIAGYIATLCAAVDEGGGGKTRAEAAAIFGKSESWAHNLVRLLELPKKWQERVASGELDQTKARALIPYAHIPTIMKELDTDYESSQWNTLDADLKRDDWEAIVNEIVHEQTRSMDRKQRHWNGGMDVDWQSFPCVIDVDAPGVREKLGIVTLKKPDGNGKFVDVELATNVELWEELQKKAAKTKHLAKGKGKATAGGKQRKPTAAELKSKNEQRARQHRDRIARWRLEWIRQLIAGRMQPTDWQVRKLLLWAAWDTNIHRLPEVFRRVVKARGGKLSGFSYEHQVPGLTSILSRETVSPGAVLAANAADVIVCDVAVEIMWPEKPDKNQPVQLPSNLIEQLGTDYDLHLSEEWAKQWEEDIRPIRAFFELHSKDQLVDGLAKELKVKIGKQAKTKAAVVDEFIGATRPLRKPKAVKIVRLVEA